MPRLWVGELGLEVGDDASPFRSAPRLGLPILASEAVVGRQGCRSLALTQ